MMGEWGRGLCRRERQSGAHSLVCHDGGRGVACSARPRLKRPPLRARLPAIRVLATRQAQPPWRQPGWPQLAGSPFGTMDLPAWPWETD